MKSLALAAALALAAPATGSAAVARFAVIAGNNVGAAGRPTLWFAEKDADRFEKALLELGDFTPERIVVLRGASATRFRDAVARLEENVAAARARGEKPLLVVFFSGHAGPGGLEFGSDRVSYD